MPALNARMVAKPAKVATKPAPVKNARRAVIPAVPCAFVEAVRRHGFEPSLPDPTRPRRHRGEPLPYPTPGARRPTNYPTHPFCS